jgi:hypothetical protein
MDLIKKMKSGNYIPLASSAWELKAGYTCWFINGTFCEGREQKDCHEKIEVCGHCEVFKSILPNF